MPPNLGWLPSQDSVQFCSELWLTVVVNSILGTYYINKDKPKPKRKRFLIRTFMKEVKCNHFGKKEIHNPKKGKSEMRYCAIYTLYFPHLYKK